jgi:hypothetical protein
MPTVRNHLAFVLLATGALGSAAAVWFGMPHEKEIANIGVLLIKLVPFVLAVEAIASLHLSRHARRIVATVAIPVSFLVYFTYFVPRIFFESANGNSIYYLVLTLTPFLILALVLAYRLGGGAAGMVRRLGYAMLLLQLSGLEDLAFLTVNNHTDPEWTPIPQVWSWADHMTVFAGRPLTKNEAFLFITIHVVLAVLILALPDRFWRRLTGRGHTADPAPREADPAPLADEPDAEGGRSRVAASPGP